MTRLPLFHQLTTCYRNSLSGSSGEFSLFLHSVTHSLSINVHIFSFSTATNRFSRIEKRICERSDAQLKMGSNFLLFLTFLVYDFSTFIRSMRTWICCIFEVFQFAISQHMHAWRPAWNKWATYMCVPKRSSCSVIGTFPFFFSWRMFWQPTNTSPDKSTIEI